MVTIRSVSDYGGFFILDSSFSDDNLIYERIENFGEALCMKTSAGIELHTSGKVNSIEINFEILSEKPIEAEFGEWSQVVESSLQSTSGTLILCRMPDGIEYPFGQIPLNSGSYNLRIYYKDEYDVRKDMENIDEDEDIYEQFKIQAWLGDLIPTRVLYVNKDWYLK